MTEPEPRQIPLARRTADRHAEVGRTQSGLWSNPARLGPGQKQPAALMTVTPKHHRSRKVYSKGQAKTRIGTPIGSGSTTQNVDLWDRQVSAPTFGQYVLPEHVADIVPASYGASRTVMRMTFPNPRRT